MRQRRCACCNHVDGLHVDGTGKCTGKRTPVAGLPVWGSIVQRAVKRPRYGGTPCECPAFAAIAADLPYYLVHPAHELPKQRAEREARWALLIEASDKEHGGNG